MKLRCVHSDYFKGSLPLPYDAVEYARCVLNVRRALIIALMIEAVSTFEKAVYID